MELAPETPAMDIDAEVRPYATDALFIHSRLTLTSSDSRVSCELLEPRESGTRRPAIVVMAGQDQDVRARDTLTDMKNVVVVTIEFPFEQRAGATLRSFFRELPEMREAALNVVPAARLALEYLR